MRNELNQIELIEAYLLGNLSTEEQSAFETRIQNDPQLAQEVEIQQQLTKRFHRSMMVAALDDAHGQWLRNNGGGGNGGGGGAALGTGTWITITLLTVVSAAACWWWFTQDGSTAELYEQEVHTPVVLDTISESDTSSTVLIPGNIEIEDSMELVTASEKPETYITSEPTSDVSTNLEEVSPALEINLPDTFTTKALAQKLDLEAIRRNELLASLAISSKEYSFTAERFSPPFDTFVIDPTEKQLLNYENGRAVISIPANILVDASGESLEDDVTLLFRDFKTNGDLVTQKIPMHWERGKNVQHFESAGMYEIRAFNDSGEVFIREYSDEPLTVSYAIDTSVKDLEFYALDDTTQRWRRKASVQLIENVPDTMPLDRDFNGGSRLVSLKNGADIETMNLVELLLEIFSLGTIDPVKRKRIGDKFRSPLKRGSVLEPQTNTTLIPDRSTNFSDVNPIQQHFIYKFGIYNYDHLRHMRDRIDLSLDAKDPNGATITGITHYIVVEQGTLAAYHYYNNLMYLSPRDAYNLVLITADERIFYASYGDFRPLLKNNDKFKKVTFKDVTDLVQSPEDFDKLFYLSETENALEPQELAN